MNILSNIIANLFHILGILLICSDLFRMEKKNCNIYKKIIVILIVDIANVLFNFLVKNINLELIFYFLCILLVMKMLYMEAIQKMIIFDIVGSIIMNLLEMIFSDISNSIFNILDIKFDYIEAIISSGSPRISLSTILYTFAGSQSFANFPPFTADKRLRIVFISTISAPQARSCFVISASSSPDTSGFSQSADPPPESKNNTVSSACNPDTRSSAACVARKEFSSGTGCPAS